ncbi:MAG: aldehyde ferredoxin oxidoreductase family protein [Thermodesulfobacteriota bacterium]|nr:aldehyde ferredoxin oxidoreductase family protein [Thermodesulfobacteriota bacterium]
MDYACMGKVLIVDLDKGECRQEAIEDEVYEKYLGGMGLGAYMLYKYVPKGADPLGPDNMLGFVPGLLTGTGSLFTGRWTVVGKSPLTGGWGDANCGGSFAPAIKRCGYDGIFFTGISKKPVYLYIKNSHAELRDASHLWGQDAVETEETLLKDTRPGAGVATIGQAGEGCSLISGICNDKGRIAARSGLGAVMGSKKLKALVLDGARRIPVYNKEEVHRLSRQCNKWVQFQPPMFPGPATAYVGGLLGKLPTEMAMDGMLYKTLLRAWGTVSMNQMSVGMGDSPIKNWMGSSKDWGPKRSKSTNPDVFTDCEKVKYHCYSCPLGCGGICSTSGKFSETHKPEYETVLALGGLLMNEDADSVFYLNELLNRAGMDSISAGGAVAFAIECYEKGILSMEDTDGLDLSWGNTSAIVALIHKMIRREGIGDILADGSKIAAERIGKGAENCAIHAGGQEMAMHDGRNDPGFALHYCVEPTPGRHTIGSQLYYQMFHLWKRVKGVPKIKYLYNKNSKFVADKNKAEEAAASSKFMSLANSAGFCLFGLLMGVDRTPVFEWLNAATGFNKTPEEYMAIGERIQTIKQAFGVKHGIEPKAFKPSDRAIGIPPQLEGPNKGRTVDLNTMMSDYWNEFGWDTTNGKPSEQNLTRLGIEPEAGGK